MNNLRTSWPYPRRLIRLVVFFSSVLAMTFWVTGEETDPEAYHESESETIAKCLDDLKSNSIEVRKRAVLILGKYSNPLAVNGVIRCLSDKSPDVRRSALVSLTEKSAGHEAVEPILKMIGDSDVHIRRIASSYIPEIMRGYRRPRLPGFKDSTSKRFSSELQNIITHAFLDDDVTVRKNMLTHLHYFSEFLTKEILLKLLGDRDREVRILALNASPILFSGNEMIEAVRSLTSDPDPIIRLRLIELIGNADDKEALEILKKLIEDDDFEISTEAYLALFRQQDFSVFPELRKRLDNDRIKGRTALKIIQIAPLMGDKGEEAIVELINHSDLTYRQAALEVYGQSYASTADMKMLIQLMNDPSKTIRETAGKILLQLPKTEFDGITSLVTSSYVDVRKTLLMISKDLPRPEMKEVLMEFILDETNEIRIRALEEIILQRIEGWESIAEQTLTDDNIEIQQKTVMLLLQRPSKRINQVLLNFAETTENGVLKQIILKRLNSGKRNLSGPLTVD